MWCAFILFCFSFSSFEFCRFIHTFNVALHVGLRQRISSCSRWCRYYFHAFINLYESAPCSYTCSLPTVCVSDNYHVKYNVLYLHARHQLSFICVTVINIDWNV